MKKMACALLLTIVPQFSIAEIIEGQLARQPTWYKQLNTLNSKQDELNSKRNSFELDQETNPTAKDLNSTDLSSESFKNANGAK